MHPRVAEALYYCFTTLPLEAQMRVPRSGGPPSGDRSIQTHSATSSEGTPPGLDAATPGPAPPGEETG